MKNGILILICIMGFLTSSAFAAPLHKVESFGPNPGNLEMKKFVPNNVRKNAPLVVLLHGCSQSAELYATGSGWMKLAEKHGFILLAPSQKIMNNLMECFNWFEPNDITRDSGEAGSIYSMIKKMKEDYSIDSRKVFVTGLSSGGAMSMVMLSTYPDIFKSGAVVAGIPYKCGTTVASAFLCMKMNTTDRSSSSWGRLVRNALPEFKGNYPTLSIWQGDLDPHITNKAARATLKQWANVHKTDLRSDKTILVNGHEVKSYKKNNKTVVQTWLLKGHAHGQPINPGNGNGECGTPSKWILDSDICAAYYMAKNWNLTR